MTRLHTSSRRHRLLLAALPALLLPADASAQMLAGRVVDSASGRPIAGAHVRLRHAAGLGLAALTAEARADSAGEFYAKAPLPGRYVVTFRPPGWAPSAPIEAELGADDFVQAVFRVPSRPPATDVVYDAWDVDVPVAPSATVTQPIYPPGPRSRGERGEVLARFVVDTAGRVEPGSIDCRTEASPEFAASVRAWLHTARFKPARIGARPVRARAQQPFAFDLAP